MAKSKSGGTRSMLRGSIANDVYSIGKDGEGKKQQVVRSRAEEVANPQTEAQMKGRMIMSTVMQAVSAMSKIIDHSFDNVPNGQTSISEFIRRNYQLIKEDVAAHPATDNKFGLNKYQEKGMKPGAYLISEGKANLPSGVRVVSGQIVISVTSESLTLKTIKNETGLKEGDYLTLCGLTDSGFCYCRCQINPNFNEDTVITAANCSEALLFDTNFEPNVEVEGKTVQIGFELGVSEATGTIYSKKTDSGFEHTTATMVVEAGKGTSSAVALPTYPIGSERFLNGGEF